MICTAFCTSQLLNSLGNGATEGKNNSSSNKHCGLNRLTSRVPKSYSFNADSVAVSYRTKDNNVNMASAETTNGGVRSNGSGREYTRVCPSPSFGVFSYLCNYINLSS